MSNKRIAVLFHRNDRRRNLANYVVHPTAEYWREDGYEVVYLFGARRFVPADVVVVHVDLSVVPDEYLELAARYPAAVNGTLGDIRKRTFSRNLLTPDDTWSGPVIVKSDLNTAGRPERLQWQPQWLHQHGAYVRAERHLHHAWERFRGRVPMDSSSDYRVYDRLHEVPARFFGDPGLVVERFMPESSNGEFHVRIFQFLGSAWSCTRFSGPKVIVNDATLTRIEPIEPHPEVLTWPARYGIEYGKLDYVETAEGPVLLDVNKTTGCAANPDERTLADRRHRATGIRDFLGGARPR